MSVASVSSARSATTAARSVPTLRRGMRGTAVRRLQDLLMRVGALSAAAVRSGPGLFGPRTQAAVALFQRRHRLRASGVADPHTQAVLRQAAAKKPAPKPKAQPKSTGAGPGSRVVLFRQGDPRWGGRRLGRSQTIRAAGCAMTATAMAISYLSKRKITPGQLDAYLDKHHGYVGDGLVWQTAARARGLKARNFGAGRGTLDAQLRAGRPVVIGVDFKPGSRGGQNGTDHWVTVVGRHVDSRRRVYYTINDPGTGRRYNLYASGNGLRGRGGLGNYRFTGRVVTFSR